MCPKKSNMIYILIPIIISLIILSIGIINLYLNLTPNLEVGTFPVKAVSVSNTLVINIENLNQTTFDPDEGTRLQHADYNFTYQVYNSGGGVARDVSIKIEGIPSDKIEIHKTFVYVGEPLEVNLLDVIQDEYNIGLLGSDKSYTFKFMTSVTHQEDVDETFIIHVNSSNAGNHIQQIVFEKE